jgi:hypothetical protein
MHRIEINGKRPLALSKADLKELFGKWPKEVDRMLWASRNGDAWLVFVSNQEGSPGHTTRVTTESAENAFDRICRGERPPRMPSERKPKKRRMISTSLPEQEIETLIGNCLEILRNLPAKITNIDINRKSGCVSLQLSDESYQIARLAKSKPGKKRRILSVVFIKNPNAPDPLQDSSGSEALHEE